jgi:uncharacterized protein HemX
MVELLLLLSILLHALCAFAWRKKGERDQCSKSEILKTQEELRAASLEKEALKVALKALKKNNKTKLMSANRIAEAKEETIRLLQEQLAGAQGHDKALREANLRLANQLADANDTISRIRDEWQRY